MHAPIEELEGGDSSYRFLAEAIPQIVWIATVDHRILYINPHWCEYTGLTFEQTLQGGWEGVIHLDDVAATVEKAVDGRARDGRYEAEYRLRRASDGTFRWHFARARIARAPDGSERWLGTAVDINDRKLAEVERLEALERELSLRLQAEEALQHQRLIEQRLLLLVEASSALLASPDSDQILKKILGMATRFVEADAYAVWRKKSDGLVWDIVTSEGLSDRYRRSLTEEKGGLSVVPREPFAVEDIEASPLVDHRMEAYRSEGVRSLLIVPLIILGRSEGTIVFYYRRKHTFSQLETRVAGGLANLASAALGFAELYNRQTTLRVHAEKAEKRAGFLAEAGRLLSSSLDFDSAMKSVAELVVPAIADWMALDVVTESGELRRVTVRHRDPAILAKAIEYRKRHGTSASKLLTRVLDTCQSTLVPQMDEATMIPLIPDAAQRDQLLRLGLTSAVASPLRASGVVLGVMTLATGGEGHNRFTEADIGLVEDLAGRVATAIVNANLYRDSRESHSALLRSNAELKRVNEDLNQFAYSASHDLREPLRMIAIYSQLLVDEYRNALDERGREFLGYTVRGAHQMEMLVHDILEYTQAATIAETPIVSVSVADAMKRVLSNLDVAIRQTGAQVLVGPVPDVCVQEVHLVQLLQNLVGNAIKYRSEKVPVIQMSAAPEGQQWRISVRDNGIGIAPEFTEQIFGIFKRLHSAADYPGTGVGLAICHKIVERYGGRIGVESEEGKGSTFWCTLPSAAAC